MEEHLWRRVEACYHAALEIPAGERAQFLAKEELEVRREVESLFLHEGDADEVLEQPVWKSLDRTTIVLHQGVLMGDYRIAGKLGSGGMGEVYRATDTKLHREVALKMLAPEFARDEAWLSRFRREARVLASLNHPNIAAVYGLEEADGALAIAMELVEGPTLAERISRGRIPVPEALNIARQIAEALEYAHENSIIHRDLKPANVKLRADGVVKVLDFGLAKTVRSTDKEAVTATGEGVILGTPAYMSPEQATGQAVDRRADIWAFGVLLFEMLSGRQIYARKSTLETLAALAGEEPDWEELPAGTPVPIRTLLHRCLDRNIKNRLRDIGEARVAIQTNGAQVLPLPQARPARLPWVIAGLLALGLAALAVLHFLEKPAEQVRFQVPLPEKGNLGYLVISPDGRKAALNIGDSIWIHTLESGESHELTKANCCVPFWSPDSRFVGYVNDGNIRVIPAAGGVSRIVTAHPHYMGWDGAAWGRDGTILFSNWSESHGLYRVDAQGGVPVQITLVDKTRNETAHWGPSFLPDGRHFVYSRSGSQPGIYVGSIDAKPSEQSLKPLVASNWQAAYAGPTSHLLFVRAGTLMEQPLDTVRLELKGKPEPVVQRVSDRGRGLGGWAEFSASATGTLAFRPGPSTDSQLTWFDPTGKTLGIVGEPGDYPGGIALSPDNTRAALIKRTGGISKIWLLDLSRNVETKFTTGAGNDDTPVWSPDGSQIIFASQRRAVRDLYRKPVDGGNEEELLLETGMDKGATSWSHDGRFLLFTNFPANSNGDIWVLPLSGGKKPFPFLTTEFHERGGQFSPDGHFIAYPSNESGRLEVYVRQFLPNAAGTVAASGKKWLISSAGGQTPRWRGDGRQLFYHQFRSDRGASQNDQGLMSVDISTTPVFQAGNPQPLGIRFSSRTIWAVTSDGKRFLAAIPVGSGKPEPYTVVLNWQAGLKK